MCEETESKCNSKAALCEKPKGDGFLEEPCMGMLRKVESWQKAYVCKETRQGRDLP